MITKFFACIVRGIFETYKGRNIYWHVLIVVATYVLVVSGFDWWFFSVTRGELSNTLGVSAGLIGFVIPVIAPALLYIIGRKIGDKDLRTVAIRVAQAGLIALIIIAFYKAVTGRVQPEFLALVADMDNSHAFNFGFLRYGIFWGWPSAHTGVAFAMSVSLALWYRHKMWVVLPALLYASYIGLGAMVSFHWFSDVFSGVILGSLIGVVVCKGGLTKPHSKRKK